MILGAGISGLSLGWFLNARFGKKIQLTILERSCRTGGWIQSHYVDGCLFEEGPRSLRPKGSGIETLRLIEHLNLQRHVIEADPAAQSRYLWVENKLKRVPSGLFSLFTSSLTRSIPWILAKEWFRAKNDRPDESIASFASRRLSPYIAEKLFDPLTAGIYAGDAHKLSIRCCFPVLHQWEQEHGSLLKGFLKHDRQKRQGCTPFIEKFSKVPLYSFKDGMETLTEALEDRLRPHIRLNTKVKALHPYSRHIEIEMEDGNIMTADHVFSAIPAIKLAPYFSDFHQELSSLLMSISGSSVAVVNLGYFSKVIKNKGFGYLIPSSENEGILGCVFDSCVFPQQNQIPEETRFTVMIGGGLAPSLVDLSKCDLKKIALRSLRKHLGIEKKPDACSIKIAKFAIPQYFVGHMEKVERIGTILAYLFPRMTLTGNSFLGISVNDCIANSKRIVENLMI